MATTINPTNSNYALGVNVKAFGTKMQNAIIDNIILNLNDLLDGTVSITSITGPLTITDTTDSTSPSTGALITLGGHGIAKALSVGTNQLFGSEVDHTISVIASTTAATVGGALTITAADGSTSGAGGALTLTGGTGGATAASVGGAITITSGASGAGTGPSGSVTFRSGVGTGSGASGNFALGTGTAVSANSGTVLLRTGVVSTLGNSGTIAVNSGAVTGTGDTGTASFGTGTATLGNSGTVTLTSGAGTASTGSVTISTGNASAGLAGNILLSPGTTSSTTVAPIVIVNGNIVDKPTSAPFFLIGTTASDGAFAKSIVGGYVEIRGATGNVQLPTGAQLTAAVGTVTTGSSFQCVFNAIGATPMTAGNTATITTNTNAVLDATVGKTLMTVTGTSNVNIGVFRFTWDGTNWIVSRI